MTRKSDSRRADELAPAAGHVAALDGVRGLAILLVIACHGCIMGTPTAFDRWFVLFPDVAYCGVDLFFVLSGFLITGILLRTKGEAGYFQNFYARRALRILPLYYLVVIFSLVVLPHFAHAKAEHFGRIKGDEFWYWTLLSNYALAMANQWRHAILDVTWSLAIEEQFYLVWPAAVLLLSGRGLRRLCGVLIGIAFVARCGMVYAHVRPLMVFALPIPRMDGLALGALIASMYHDGVGLGLLARLAKPVALLACVGFVGLRLLRPHDAPANADPVFQVVGYTLIVAWAGGTLVAAERAQRGTMLHAAFNSSFLRFFGKYSYALYLFHLPFRALLRDTVLGPQRLPTVFGSPVLGQLMFYVVATAPAVLAAWLSWHLFEVHFLRLKRFFTSARASEARERKGVVVAVAAPTLDDLPVEAAH